MHLSKKIFELVLVGIPNLWGHVRDRVLMACDELCGKKMGRRWMVVE